MKKLFILLALFGGLSISAFAQSGKITGKLTYPSDFIPGDMVMCVKFINVYSEPIYCSNDRASRLRKGKISFKLNYRAASYQISLPGGSYHLYATTGEMPGVKAYYDEFVKCGMNVDCKSKTPIAVKVRLGQTTRGITVGDFWD
jgi:hypothetical protein